MKRLYRLEKVIKHLILMGDKSALGDYIKKRKEEKRVNNNLKSDTVDKESRQNKEN